MEAKNLADLYDLATLDWTPRYDDLDTIATHALAWEERLFQERGGPQRHAESA